MLDSSNNDTCTAVTLFITMIASMLTSSLEKSELNNRTCQSLPNFFIYDFVVVGGGTSGSVVAGLLSENPSWQVLVLEAGSEEIPLMDVPSFAGLSNPSFLWNLTAKSQSGVTHLITGKSLGGTSAVDNMLYVRGSKDNYDSWVKNYGADGWSYEDLLPYFDILENYRGTNDQSHPGYGSLGVKNLTVSGSEQSAFLQAFQSIGLPQEDYSSASQIGASVPMVTVLKGVRQSANAAFLKPVRSRKNLVLKLKSRATKIVIDPFTKRAVGVDYINEEGKSTIVYAKKEVILSAGVFHSPQLLMLSGIGPKSDLNKLRIPVVSDLPVGKKLQTQVMIKDVFVFSVDPPKSSSPLAEKISEWTQYVTNQTGPMAVPSTIVTAFQSFGEDPTLPDIQYVVHRDFSLAGCANISYESTFYNKLVLTPILVNPKSVGQIGLKDINPMSDPLIDTGILKNPEDGRVFIEALKALYTMKDSSVFRNNNITFDGTNVAACDSLLKDCCMDTYWDCAIKQRAVATSQATSSCPIGPSAKDGVVDPKLQVYGVRNLRVIDASVIPAMISGSTVTVSTVIGLKGADLIKKDWQ